MAVLGTALPATSAPSFDGIWSVVIVTESGTCDRAYRYPIRISNGAVLNEGSSPATISGKVANNGMVTVIVSAGSKSAVFRAGASTGLATAIVFATFAMFQGHFWTWDTLATVFGAVLGGALILPILALFLSPLLEALFGYVTDVELLKLANFNHPVLKDLIVQAPGTYHHGILIGQLVEAAAREIGANPLLARVGAYYHDIGKGKNPLCFGENQKGENRLEGLTPHASAEIIRRHTSIARPSAAPPRGPRRRGRRRRASPGPGRASHRA